jgi:hypothetical protein
LLLQANAERNARQVSGMKLAEFFRDDPLKSLLGN